MREKDREITLANVNVHAAWYQGALKGRMKIVTVGADLGIEPGMTSWGSQYGVGRGSLSSVQFSSVTQLCLTLCNPTDCSMPGYPVHHQLLKLAQTHVHWVSDAIQPSHPLLSSSPPAFNLSQHQGLFQWVSSSNQVAKVLELHLQHQSFQWIFSIDFL